MRRSRSSSPIARIEIAWRSSVIAPGTDTDSTRNAVAATSAAIANAAPRRMICSASGPVMSPIGEIAHIAHAACSGAASGGSAPRTSAVAANPTAARPVPSLRARPSCHAGANRSTTRAVSACSRSAGKSSRSSTGPRRSRASSSRPAAVHSIWSFTVVSPHAAPGARDARPASTRSPRAVAAMPPHDRHRTGPATSTRADRPGLRAILRASTRSPRHLLSRRM